MTVLPQFQLLAMFPIWSMLLLALLALGALTAIALGVVVALINRRPGVAMGIGGIGLTGLIGIGVLVIAPLEIAAATGNYSVSVTSVPWAFAALRLLIVAAVVALVLTMVLRQPPENEPCRRGRGWWRMLVIPPLLLLLFVGTARVERTVVRAPEVTASVSHDLVKLDAELASMNIHTLMDIADAPRIALAPEPPAPPAEPAEPTGPNDGEAASAAVSENTPNEPPAEEVAPEVEAEQSPADSETAKAKVASAAAIAETAEPSSDAKPESLPEEPPSPRAQSTNPSKSETPKPPSWIHEPPKRVGHTWRQVLVTDEFATQEECDREADRLLIRATFDHLHVVADLSDPPLSPSRVPSTTYNEPGQVVSNEDQTAAEYLGHIGITIDYIRREIAQDEYVERVDRSFGPMKKLYTLVEFTPAVDRELKDRWESYRRQARFATVGAGAGSILGLLALAWGLLKIDTATKGYYTKRLFLGVPAAIVSVVGLLVALAEVPMPIEVKAAIIASVVGGIAAITALPRLSWS